MKSIQQIVCFASAARHQSFAAAARELGLTPSTVAKSIGRLETHLGISVFNRSTRNMTLTAEGVELLERYSLILREIEAAETSLSAVRSEPSGLLSLNVPVTYGRQVVVPVISSLTARFPALQVDIRLSDQMVDVIANGFDAVVRIGLLADSDMVATGVGQQTLVTCASPSYLAANGVPTTISDLAHHRCLAYVLPSTGKQRAWQFRVGQTTEDVVVGTCFRLNDGEAVVEAATCGAGIAQVPDYMARNALEAGRLMELLSAFRPASLPISVLCPKTRMTLPKVRAFIDSMRNAASGSSRIEQWPVS